jgi:hypothetical protein
LGKKHLQTQQTDRPATTKHFSKAGFMVKPSKKHACPNRKQRVERLGMELDLVAKATRP